MSEGLAGKDGCSLDSGLVGVILEGWRVFWVLGRLWVGCVFVEHGVWGGLGHGLMG